MFHAIRIRPRRGEHAQREETKREARPYEQVYRGAAWRDFTPGEHREPHFENDEQGKRPAHEGNHRRLYDIRVAADLRINCVRKDANGNQQEHNSSALQTNGAEVTPALSRQPSPQAANQTSPGKDQHAGDREKNDDRP